MTARTYRYLILVLLGFALLAALPGPAAAGGASAFDVSAQEPNLSQDFDFSSLAKAACHGIVSCQPDYPSCAGWSGYSDCDTPFCGSGPKCGDCEDIGPCPGPAWRQKRERFRVCFNAVGQSCTEWQTTIVISCGC